MSGRLTGKVAVVTGAGAGIGRGIARRFAREGCRVVVAERDEETGRATAESLAGLGSDGRLVVTDVRDERQARGCVRAALEAWGRVDVLVNNAWGGGTIGRIEWKTSEQVRHGFDVAFMAALWTMQEALAPMRDQGGGSIVNLCSLNGVNAHAFSLEYNAAKEALRTLTRTAAVEWGRHAIRVNAICPAAATEAYVAFRDANPKTAAEMLRQNPMGRMGDPEDDIGGAALFLASDDSRYVTGNTLFVDGGSHVNGVSWRPELPDDLPGAGSGAGRVAQE
jgi:NAD(P)-dependent dehydrogenase (short-subunit alcohol dehydrogenase family)